MSVRRLRSLLRGENYSYLIRGGMYGKFMFLFHPSIYPKIKKIVNSWVKPGFKSMEL